MQAAFDLLDLPVQSKFVQTHCERCGCSLSKLRSSRVPESAYSNLCGSCITPVEYAGMQQVLETYITPTSGQYVPMTPPHPLTYDEGLAMLTDGIVASTDEGAAADNTVKPSATRPNKAVKASKTATKAKAKKAVPLDLEPAPAPEPAQKASKSAAGKAKKGAIATLVNEEKTKQPELLKTAKTKGTKKVSNDEAELLGAPPKATKKAAKVVAPANDTKLSADDVFKALKKAGGTATVADLAAKNKWMPVRVHGAGLALKSQKRVTYANKTLTIAADDPLA